MIFLLINIYLKFCKKSIKIRVDTGFNQNLWKFWTFLKPKPKTKNIISETQIQTETVKKIKAPVPDIGQRILNFYLDKDKDYFINVCW